MKSNEGKLWFSFPLCRTTWAQNLILDQFVGTLLKHTNQKYNFNQKKPIEGKIVSIAQPLLILLSIN